jgi:hypothetical protein
MLDLAPLRLVILISLPWRCDPLPQAPPLCLDADADHICDVMDMCQGANAAGDADVDHVCDDRDPCFGDNATGDVDADLICEDLDLCFGPDAEGDADADRLCDGADACFGTDALGDADADGSCDDRDLCVGDDAEGDADSDQICDGDDLCDGDDALGDSDGDGSCDNRDLCTGDDRTGDPDGDSLCNDSDVCPHAARLGDMDSDGICDDIDPCDDRVVAPGSVCEVPDPPPPNPRGCAPQLFEGRHTGFVICSDGSVNRLFPTTGWLRPETNVPANQPLTWGGQHTCTQDADCADGPHGSCYGLPSYLDVAQSCIYGCDGDDDCQAGEACLPPTAGWFGYNPQPRSYVEGSPIHGRGLCVQAECHSADDCESGECGFRWEHLGCGTNGYYHMLCRTAQDSCRTNRTCQVSYSVWGGTTYHEAQCGLGGDWTCHDTNTICGRPLADDNAQWHTAAPTARADWQAAEVAPDPAMAAWWSQVAALEHASVASFARHMLELMSLGAPADLLMDVARAQQDEIEHARLAYALAGVDGPCGPGPLLAPPPRVGRGAILTALIEEGCVGETVAAAEARLMAERVADPRVQGTLLRIAEDEARHAALAWRTLVWLLRDEADLRVARAAFSRALAGTDVAEEVAGVGPLSARELASLRRRVLDSVIGPAWAEVERHQA